MVDRDAPAAGLPIAIRGGTAVAEIDAYANPTGGFGISVCRGRLTGASYSSMRSDDRHIISLQLSGPVDVDVRLGGRRLTHTPRRGSIGIAPAGADAIAETLGPVEGIFLRVNPECLALASAQLGHHAGILIERMKGRDAVLSRLGYVLMREAEAGLPNGLICWTSITDALFRRLVSGHLSTPAPTFGQTLGAGTLARVDDYVRSNLSSALDIPSLAAVAECDLFRFARAFKAATGMNPHRYVTRLRLEHARALMLTSTLSLVDIALETGFCDQSHMSRWMRRVYGVSPGTFARRPRDRGHT